jgi:hypothetical protein
MSEPAKIKWRIAGEEFASCNCSWGCPCQFNALPTTGRCEAFVTCLISDGYFGDTRLDGVLFLRIYVYCHVGAGDKLAFELKNTYAHFNAFNWSN